MKADLERFQRKASVATDDRRPLSQQQASSSASEPSSVKEALDKILIADFFVVLAILAWLVLGVVQQGTTGDSGLLDAWYPLWPLVWQPAIGVLMLGALVSGGVGWVAEQKNKSS